MCMCERKRERGGVSVSVLKGECVYGVCKRKRERGGGNVA